MIELLTELVSINSIYPEEENLGNLLYYYLLSYGFTVKKHYISEKRFNLLAEKGTAEKAYLLYAHMDTVPVYGEWQEDPLKLRIEGDKAIGLGSVDMKAGIVAILKAVEKVKPQNYKLKVCFGVDEENYSEGAYRLAKTSWLHDVKGVLVPESSLPYYKSEKAGSTISIGKKGRCVFTLKVYGKSTHGVNYDKGVSALEEGIKLITALKDLKQTYNEKLGHTNYFVRRFESKSTSLSTPAYAEIDLDFHLVSPDNSNSLKEKLFQYIQKLYDDNLLAKGEKDFEIEFFKRPTPFLEPYLFETDNPFIQLVSQAVTKVYGECEYNIGQSVGDENVFGNLGIPTLTVGPLGDNHHSAEEWVSLSSIEKLTEIYKEVLNSLENKNN